MKFLKFKSFLCIILVFVCRITYFFQYFENELFEKNVPKVMWGLKKVYLKKLRFPNDMTNEDWVWKEKKKKKIFVPNPSSAILNWVLLYHLRCWQRVDYHNLKDNSVLNRWKGLGLWRILVYMSICKKFVQQPMSKYNHKSQPNNQFWSNNSKFKNKIDWRNGRLVKFDFIDGNYPFFFLDGI